MTDKPGTAGRPVRRFAGCALPIALASVLLALAVFLGQKGASAPNPPGAQAAHSNTRVQVGQVVQQGGPAVIVPSTAATSLPNSSLKFPALTGPVVDQANIIPDDEEVRLTQKLLALKQQSNRELQVVTLASLDGNDISDYGYQLGRAWGLGDKARGNAAILIVAPNERRMRVEVGYELEGTLTDGLSWLIISKVITPKFKAGDLPGGIEDGTDALIAQLQLPADQAAQVAAQANAQQAATQKAAKDQFNPASLIWIAFIVLFFILPMLRRMRGGRGYRSSGLGNVIMWSVLDGMTRGGGGGGGSGWSGGSGGGGSSWGGGGGGGFGGGGASGSW